MDAESLTQTPHRTGSGYAFLRDSLPEHYGKTLQRLRRFLPTPDLFAEAELSSPDDYAHMKHSRDFDKFARETLPDGRIVFRYDNGSVSYSYEFTEL